MIRLLHCKMVEMKHLYILGAGISGLTAGIYALKKGYKVTIIDKNEKPGGLVCAYYKDGYKIDLCLHWLTGTGDKTTAHEIWKDIGAINKDSKFYAFDHLNEVEVDGIRYYLSRDIDECEKDLLNKAPEDSKQIKQFFSWMRKYSKKYSKKENKRQKILSYIRLLPIILKTAKISRIEYAERFKNKGLRLLFKTAQAGFNALFGLIYEYALFITGNADVPIEGSDGFINNIVNNYLSLGGELLLNESVNKLNVINNKVVDIITNKNTYHPDEVISALSPYELFNNLLPNEYKDNKYITKYNNQVDEESFIPTMFGVIITVPISLVKDLSIPFVFNVSPIKIATKTFEEINFRSYHYSKLHKKGDKTVVNILFDLDVRDYDYFKSLNEKEYQKQKEIIVNEVIDRIIKKYPEFKGNIGILDTFSPLTIEKYARTPCGGYMAYSISKKGGMFSHKRIIKGIKNLTLASQWISSPGGTPLAALAGKKAIKK